PTRARTSTTRSAASSRTARRPARAGTGRHPPDCATCLRPAASPSRTRATGNAGGGSSRRPVADRPKRRRDPDDPNRRPPTGGRPADRKAGPRGDRSQGGQFPRLGGSTGRPDPSRPRSGGPGPGVHRSGPRPDRPGGGPPDRRDRPGFGFRGDAEPRPWERPFRRPEGDRPAGGRPGEPTRRFPGPRDATARPGEEAFVARRPARRLLVVPQRRQALERLVLHATSLRIPVVEVEGGTLTATAGFDGHQGIGLVVEPRTWASLDEILARAVERGEPPFLLVLDSLEDPQNVGTLLRSAEAAGIHGVVFPT